MKNLEKELQKKNYDGALRQQQMLQSKKAAAGVRLRARIISAKVKRSGNHLLNTLTFFDVYGCQVNFCFFFSFLFFFFT